LTVLTRAIIVLALASPLSAQGTGVVLPARFNLPPAEPFLRKPVQHLRFAEAVGRRSALLGCEDGTFEAWINPVKILRDFRLSVYLDGALDAVPLADLAQSITTAPGRTTITHAHAAFTIRQTWFAPLDRQSLVVLLDIDTSKPLRLRASFVPELRPMWPASFGGLTFTWSAGDHAFLLNEGTRRHSALVGSPLFIRGSVEPATLEMDVTPEMAQSRFIPIVIAGSSAGEDAARRTYRDSLASIQEMMTEADGYYRDFQAKTMRIQTPEPLLNQAFEWAKLAIEKGWTCTDKVGCGLIGGFGPSGTSDRPGRGWYFGADALLDSWSIVDYGDLDRARAVLEFLRDRQRADGKILDQLTQSAGLVDWSLYPYGYVHAESTPLYLFSAARYVVRSGDMDFLRLSWPSLEKAYRFCISTADTDGLLLNKSAGPAAAEPSALGGRVAKDIYLEGVWLSALDGYAILAGLAHNNAALEDARKRLEQARRSLDAWFREDRGYFPFAALQGGATYNAQSSWQALALVYGGVDTRKAERAAASFASTQLTTPWGTRLFAGDAPDRDPAARIDTSVWPLTTGFVSLAEFRNHRARAGLEHLYSIASLTGFSGSGFVPEDLSGERAQVMPQAVPHQLFSSSSVIHPMVRGLLGLGGDAFEGAFSFVPHIPAHWQSLKFEMYRIGQSWVSGEVTRQTGMLHIRLTVIGKPLKFYLAPALPLNTTVKGLKVNGKKTPPKLEPFDTDVHAVLESNPAMGLDVVWQLREGVETRPDLPVFEVGEAATPVQARPATAAAK
jgi:glycogen debranching enzyme